MKTLLLIIILLVVGCAKENPLGLNHKYKIGDCFRYNSDLKKSLQGKVFTYKVTAVKLRPTATDFDVEHFKYGHYETDSIYMRSNGKLHSVPEIPSFEHDKETTKVDCPKSYE